MAKTSISLVSVQKPTMARSPILARRNKLASNIDREITKIGLFREGKRVSKTQFWSDGGGLFFSLRYGRAPLELEKGKSTLKAATFDDLVEQLDQIKTIAVAGGLDDALAACANAVRSNFKAAKDKKAKAS
jgi:hypothetical protein